MKACLARQTDRQTDIAAPDTVGEDMLGSEVPRQAEDQRHAPQWSHLKKEKNMRMRGVTVLVYIGHTQHITKNNDRYKTSPPLYPRRKKYNKVFTCIL